PPAGLRAGVIAGLCLLATACGGDAADPVTTTLEPRPVTTASVTEAVPVLAEFDVQGHRGARGLKPENTLPAFETALDLGVSTLELDLHFTSDGEVVVWHDAAIEREKCGLAPDAPPGLPDPDDVLVPEPDRLIAGLTSAQLAGYRCDRNPSESTYPDQTSDPTALAGADYRIVTLGELFDFVAAYRESPDKTDDQRTGAAGVLFNVETKRKPDRPETIGDGFDGIRAGPFELAILAEIADRGLGDRVIIQSFDHRSLWAVHAEDPAVKLAALSSRESVDLSELAARGASIWSPNRQVLDRDSLERAHDVGLEVIPWTVNDPTEMADLIAVGVDGLISDRPDLLLDVVTEVRNRAGE
ncbi:MAG: hypothetical protein KJO17_12210, partial [Acidimicrobiia bacterium]|nr:hypothetical protein [Acidimicrobiia bacterium]